MKQSTDFTLINPQKIDYYAEIRLAGVTVAYLTDESKSAKEYIYKGAVTDAVNAASQCK